MWPLALQVEFVPSMPRAICATVHLRAWDNLPIRKNLQRPRKLLKSGLPWKYKLVTVGSYTHLTTPSTSRPLNFPSRMGLWMLFDSDVEPKQSNMISKMPCLEKSWPRVLSASRDVEGGFAGTVVLPGWLFFIVGSIEFSGELLCMYYVCIYMICIHEICIQYTCIHPKSSLP